MSARHIRLTSGRVIDPNNGILGLSLDPDHPGLFGGYDSPIEGGDASRAREYADLGLDTAPPITPHERGEIADLMISRWLAWKESGQ